MPQSVGIFGASETENASVAHVPTRLYVFPALAGPPPAILPTLVVVVEGPVMIKVVKSKRIYVYSIFIIVSMQIEWRHSNFRPSFFDVFVFKYEPNLTVLIKHLP